MPITPPSPSPDPDDLPVAGRGTPPPTFQTDPASIASAGLGLARLTVGTTARLGRWGLGATLRAGSRVLQAAVSGETATTLIDDAAMALRDQARDLLGIVDEAGRVVGFQMPGDDRTLEADAGSASTRRLQARGKALLDASADVDHEQPVHPAYVRILDELAPDEARIIRLLALEGPQPAVDVRTSSPLPGGSQLLAPGLTMVGAEAGTRHVDRVPLYLNNLERLGLVWFSREPVPDPTAYQVLEAQPDVLQALGRGRTKTVRRSIQITPFGQQFAEQCLPLR